MNQLFQAGTRDMGTIRKLSFHEIAGSPPRQFFLFRPSTETAGAPLVVSVHGIARNAATHAFRLAAEAERYGVCVIAPLFTKKHYGQYQQLEDLKTGARSDLALLEMLDEARRLSQADVSRVLLFGYSGGAQFAHRFAMANPDRVRSAVLAAAGWYTMPDRNAAYPYGVDAKGFSMAFDLGAMTEVAFHVIVGQRDVERDQSLRTSEHLDQSQGLTRLERAKSWVEAMACLPFKGNAPTFETLPHVGHNFVEAAERANLAQLILARFATDAELSPIPTREANDNVL